MSPLRNSPVLGMRMEDVPSPVGNEMGLGWWRCQQWQWGCVPPASPTWTGLTQGTAPSSNPIPGHFSTSCQAFPSKTPRPLHLHHPHLHAPNTSLISEPSHRRFCSAGAALAFLLPCSDL